MPLILLMYANDTLDLLQMLEKECNNIQQSLLNVPNKKYEVRMLPAVNPQALIDTLNRDGDKIEIIHYSGHANNAAIAFEEQHGQAKHLADVIKERCPNLKLLFLNACETKGQVEAFHNANVPYVIATNAKVRDDESAWVSTQFFNYLTLGRDIESAFEATRNDGHLFEKNVELDSTRGDFGKKKGFVEEDELNWHLYMLEGAKEYHLPLKAYQFSETESVNHSNFVANLILSLKDYESPESSDYIYTIEAIENSGSQEEQTIITDLLNILPYPIGIRLRQITASDRLMNEADEDDYHQELLYDYVCFLDTLFQYTVGLLSCQLWEHRDKIDKDQLREDIEYIKAFIQSNLLQHKFEDYVPVLRKMSTILSVSGIPHPCEKLMDQLDALGDFQEAYSFFDMHRNYFWQKIRFEEAEGLQHCYQAQDYLAKIFSHFGFIIENILVSIRSINVINFRHVKEKYTSEIWPLLASEKGRRREKNHDKPMENKSVLCYNDNRFGADAKSINLFPFFIDRSAFSNQSGDVLDLYQFVGYCNDDWFNEHSLQTINSACFYFVCLKNPSKIWRFNESDINNATLWHIDEKQDPNKKSRHMLAVAGELRNYFNEFKAFLNL